MRQTLRKSDVLRGHKHFRELYIHGNKIADKLFSCSYIVRFPRGDEKPAIVVGFAVGSKTLKATSRNRLKRLMREAYRRMKPQLIEKVLREKIIVEAVFTAASSALKLTSLPSYDEVYREMESSLQKVLQR